MVRPTPALARALDTLGKKVPQFVGKHPVLTTAAVGTGAAALGRAPQADRLEKTMMSEMYGAPGAKYSSCAAMNKFAGHHITLESRVAFIKKAEEWRDPQSWKSPTGPLPMDTAVGGALAQGIGSQAAKEGVSGLRRLVGSAFQAIKDMFFDEPKRQAMLQQIIQTDPVVKTFDRENPGQAAAAFQTMSNFAPTLSSDPNITTAFLRNAAMSGGTMDHQMVKGLAEAETQVQRAKNEGAYLKGGF